MSRETRILGGARIETRSDPEARKIVGYAAVFDSPTDIGGYFREQVRRGAFKDALKADDIHAVYNHDYGVVLGRAKAGTLTLAEDDHGLRIEITPPDTQAARDLLASIERGDIDQMSFAFTMAGGKQTWDESQDPPLRTIEKVGELFEVSVVPRGAYPDTEAGVRSLEAARAEQRQRNFCAARLRLRMKQDLAQRENG